MGHYGGQNTGDDAMLLACVKQLSRMGAEIRYITRTGKAVPFVDAKDRAVPVSRNPTDVLNSVAWADWVVLGGGTHFHDDYKTKRLLRHYSYMSLIIGVCALAKRFGKQVAWIGMGLGPFHTFVGRRIFALALRFVDYISVRDRASLEEVRGYKYNATVIKSFDLSAILLKDSSIAVQSEKQTSMVLGVSPTLLHGSEERIGVSSGKFWQFVAKNVARHFRNENMLIRIFEFRGGDRENDRALCLMFAEVLKKSGVKRIEYIHYTGNPLKTLSLMAECSWFIASRYHSAMFAYLMGRPTLILPYHRKLIDLADEVQWRSSVRVHLNGPEWREELVIQLHALKAYPEHFIARRPISDALNDAMKSFEVFN